MIRIEGRFEVKLISADALAGYMKFRGYSVRTLADELGDSKLRSTIGHLRSGKRSTCDPKLAKAIEKLLQAPPNSLFVPRVSNVAREVGQKVPA